LAGTDRRANAVAPTRSPPSPQNSDRQNSDGMAFALIPKTKAKPAPAAGRSKTNPKAMRASGDRREKNATEQSVWVSASRVL